MQCRKTKVILFMVMAFIITFTNSVNGQSFQREFNNNLAYIYIEDHSQKYTVGGEYLPHDRLCISNISNSSIKVRLIMQVTQYGRNGEIMKVQNREITQTVNAGKTNYPNFYMSTRYGGEYYCVTGFRVLSVNTQGNNQYSTQNNKYYVVKNQVDAYYYDYTNRRFICNGTWNEGARIYLTGNSYDSNGIKLLETTAVTNDNSSYWYIPSYAFQ